MAKPDLTRVADYYRLNPEGVARLRAHFMTKFLIAWKLGDILGIGDAEDTVAAGCDLRQDDAGLGVVLVCPELGAQELQEPARERAARASV